MSDSLRILVLGATGTIGKATVRALLRRGHEVVCFARPRTARDAAARTLRRSAGGSASRAELRPGSPDETPDSPRPAVPDGAEVRLGDVGDPASVARDGFRGEAFDAVVSCMASRTGVSADAWAVDHRAHRNVLEAARGAGVRHFVLLSAICVQKPRLEFQRAKLAFEEELRASGLTWSIVRPTAFFKSISGQVERVKAGKPFLVFGDGTLTSCKPIGDDDLAEFLAGCLDDPERWNRILPIGGPGPALTARDQGRLLFEAVGAEPRFRRIPVWLLHAVVGALGVAARVVRPLKNAAELARIARYYATESMLVWDADAQRYDADATPEFGTERLGEYYRRLVRGEVRDERGEHALL